MLPLKTNSDNIKLSKMGTLYLIKGVSQVTAFTLWPVAAHTAALRRTLSQKPRLYAARRYRPNWPASGPIKISGESLSTGVTGGWTTSAARR